jgi:monofunctional biosynthetic peptidoglycan transglycosylase
VGKQKKIQLRWEYLPQISPDAIKAVIIAEDDKFWRHVGFDFDAMQKALEKDIKKKSFKAGGSTISQQLAKNLYLSPSKNPVRKIKEAILTWRIEQRLSKKRIIELYLNVAEWGDGFFGIEEAARRYFGKPASALTAMESARLAAVLPNPLRFNPVGNSRYVASRSERIYQIMVRRGIVIPEYEEMMAEKGDETDVPGSSPEAIQRLEDQVKDWQKEAEKALPKEKEGEKQSSPPGEKEDRVTEEPGKGEGHDG